MSKGGPIKMADGGITIDPSGFDSMMAGQDPFSVASSTDTEKAKGVIPPAPERIPDPYEEEGLAAQPGNAGRAIADSLISVPSTPAKPTAPVLPVSKPIAAAAPIAQPAAPVAAPAAQPQAADKLTPDQYDDLIASLKPGMGQRLGQGAMSGLAGLADAIMQGVARAGNPGFQHNIMEQQQQQKENLINALKAKYGHGLEREKMSAENMRAANALASEEKRTGQTIAAENERAKAERGLKAEEMAAGRQQQGIEAAAKLPATGFLHPSTWGKGAEIERVRNQLLTGTAGAGPVLVKTTAEYNSLPKGTHYVDVNGKQGVKK